MTNNLPSHDERVGQPERQAMSSLPVASVTKTLPDVRAGWSHTCPVMENSIISYRCYCHCWRLTAVFFPGEHWVSWFPLRPTPPHVLQTRSYRISRKGSDVRSATQCQSTEGNINVNRYPELILSSSGLPKHFGMHWVIRVNRPSCLIVLIFT